MDNLVWDTCPPDEGLHDVSGRGKRESGRDSTALLPRTPIDGGIAAATGTDGVDRRLAAVDAAWEFVAADAARELAMPAISGATDVRAGANAPSGFPLLLLLV